MSDKNETELNKYKKEGKTLTPPLAQIGITKSSWINDRLPEVLWAALIVTQMKREDALDFFRHCLKYIEGKEDLFDVTFSGISKFPAEHRIGFIKHLLSYSKQDIKIFLRPILFFSELPSFEDWNFLIGQELDPAKDWPTLGTAIRDCLWHQSQEATDCRWVKLTATVIAGKMHLPTAEMVKEILLYPDEGDQRKVRPFIRASEVMPMLYTQNNEWSKKFWKYCHESTKCIPEQDVNGKIEEKYKILNGELKSSHKHYYNETRKVRNALIDHFFDTSQTTAIDSRHESVFGLALYGLDIFIENNLYHTGVSVNGRAMLRILFETYTTLAYLVKKEFEDPQVWDDYRSYGSGQANLIYRKYEEGSLQSSTVDKDKVEAIANEDAWVEFVPINLGHWDSSDLRKMCEYLGEKKMYDKYYAYTSGFVHGNWAAVRESIFVTTLFIDRIGYLLMICR